MTPKRLWSLSAVAIAGAAGFLLGKVPPKTLVAQETSSAFSAVSLGAAGALEAAASEILPGAHSRTMCCSERPMDVDGKRVIRWGCEGRGIILVPEATK